MGKKKKDVIDEIEEKVRELIDLFTLEKTMMCDPSKNDYARCVLKKAYIHVELRKRRDKLVRQLSFEYVTGELAEKETIEEMVNAMSQIGLLSENEWMKAVNDAMRYVFRLDGMEPREKVRKISNEIDKALEEEGFR
ncbi:MAG: hypothetical protein JHC26_04475 [Thermofilum sp.]|jgi:hypothetical protein|uniref:hypothetical protein n=1 Tax=Thermofilum sp. TaxID=1961369 RepID=UPI00258DCAD9|nr:hypothetical protein [Thermofilum sp.]MCI4408323.1 hypothetical protein [Thermofilum sp.]